MKQYILFYKTNNKNKKKIEGWMMKIRCPWANDNKLLTDYHDQEWGVPVHDDRLLFEFFILEGAQAGLSWNLILQKRDNYREAFDNFQIDKVTVYSENKIDELRNNPGIIRNRLKIRATVTNALAVQKIQEEY